MGWSHDHYAIVIAVVFALTALSSYYTYLLFQDVRTDFATLLPDSDRSKQDFETLKQRYGGATEMQLVVGGEDFEKNKAFVERFVAELEKHKDELSIREIKYRRTADDRFFDEHKFLYVDLADLKEVDKRLKRRITWEKCNKSPFCVSIDDKPEFTTEDIEEKYRRRYKGSAHNVQFEVMVPLGVMVEMGERNEEIMAWERCEESPGASISARNPPPSTRSSRATTPPST